MVTITPVNDVWVHVDADPAILKELSDFFSYDVPGAVHIRRQSNYKKWDGKIRLFKRQHLYRGLCSVLLDFCTSKQYPVYNRVPQPSTLPLTYVAPMPLRTHQDAALRIFCEHHRGLIISPTSSGKSLIIHGVHTQAYEETGTPTLIVVPTLGLVEQMKKDFISYGTPAAHIQTIMGGRSKVIGPDATVVISTWQSIFQESEDFFDQFQCVLVDEVHLAKAKSLVAIMERLTQCPFRVGFTGTLNDMEVHRLVLEGLFGPAYVVATTHELTKKGDVSPLHIRMCMLKYPEVDAKQLRHVTYQEEIEFLVTYAARNRFIAELALRTTGNTLVLFQLEKQGHALRELLKTATVPVYYIDGKTPVEDRVAIQHALESDTGAILLASYGTTQLGISIKNLHNMIFAHPAKGSIRVIQSIGRLLRLHASKSTAILYDIVDDLRTGKYINFSMNHGILRYGYYAQEQHKVSKIDCDIATLTHTAT